MEFDHQLCLWLKLKKSRKTHLNTHVEGGAAQSGRKIAHCVDVINIGRSAGTILTDVIMPDTAQNNYFSLSDK